MQRDIVTVATYSHDWEAQIAKNLLEENGIGAFIANENSAGAFKGVSALVEIELQVAAADAARATELLSATES